MHETALALGSTSLSWGDAVAAGAALVVLLLFAALALLLRSRRERALEAALSDERAREMDDKVAELVRIQAEMTGRLQTVAEVFGSRQGDFVRFLSERIDGLQHRVGQGLEAGAERQA